MLLFSLSNGHLSTLCFIHGPQLVAPEKAEKANSQLAALLGLGLLTGALLSFAFALIG